MHAHLPTATPLAPRQLTLPPAGAVLRRCRPSRGADAACMHVQVQSRLLDEQGFRDTVALLQAGQAQLRNHVRARAADLLQSSMHRCLALWQSRTRRRARLDRLKRTLNHSRGFAGADPRTLLEEAFATPPRSPPSADAPNGCGGDDAAPDDRTPAPAEPHRVSSGSGNTADAATLADPALLMDSDSLGTPLPFTIQSEHDVHVTAPGSTRQACICAASLHHCRVVARAMPPA